MPFLIKFLQLFQNFIQFISIILLTKIFYFMKKKILVGSSVVVAGLVVLAGIYSLGKFSFDGAEGRGEIIASSDYGKVYKSDIQDYLDKIAVLTGNKVDINSLQKEGLEFIAKDIVVQKKLTKEARKSSVKNKSDVKAKIRNATDNILKAEYLTYIAEKNITDDAIKAKYDSLKKNLEGKKEYKIKHILVGTQEEAREATKMLYQKSFEEVAREVSVDSGTAQNGGELGYLVLDSVDKDFSDQVIKQKVGKVSTPFKTKFGWHIVVVEDIRDAKPIPFADAKNNLKQQMKTQYVNDYIKDLFDKTEVNLLKDQKEGDSVTQDANNSVKSEKKESSKEKSSKGEVTKK